MVNFEPHLHASGTRMCAEAIYPDGRAEMLNCAGYNHAWVKSYTYEEDYAPLLPAGTIVHLIAFYNNTASNPRVVDPRNWRGTGHRSIDDMLILLSKWITYSDEEFKQVVAEREARLKQIRTTFHLTQGGASFWLTFLYIGALPALFITRRADAIGRRRVLLFSITAYTVATGLTAAAPTIALFVGLQFFARLFLHAESAVVWTIAAEELPADARGFGFGVLGMNNALGGS